MTMTMMMMMMMMLMMMIMMIMSLLNQLLLFPISIYLALYHFQLTNVLNR